MLNFIDYGCKKSRLRIKHVNGLYDTQKTCSLYDHLSGKIIYHIAYIAIIEVLVEHG